MEVVKTMSQGTLQLLILVGGFVVLCVGLAAVHAWRDSFEDDDDDEPYEEGL